MLDFFPVYNDCSSSQQITRSRSCGNVAEPTLTYSPETAEKLAKWSSLSYITPGISDEANTQNVVRSQIGDNYRVCLSKPLCHAQQPRGNRRPFEANGGQVKRIHHPDPTSFDILVSFDMLPSKLHILL